MTIYFQTRYHFVPPSFENSIIKYIVRSNILYFTLKSQESKYSINYDNNVRRRIDIKIDPVNLIKSLKIYNWLIN